MNKEKIDDKDVKVTLEEAKVEMSKTQHKVETWESVIQILTPIMESDDEKKLLDQLRKTIEEKKKQFEGLKQVLKIFEEKLL